MYLEGLTVADLASELAKMPDQKEKVIVQGRCVERVGRGQFEGTSVCLVSLSDLLDNEEIKKLEIQIENLEGKVDELEMDNGELEGKNEKLQARITELEEIIEGAKK